MIKASELRIGNVAKPDCSQEYVFVTPNLIVEQHLSELSGKQYLQPIPITEDWLIKLGFEESWKTNYKLQSYNCHLLDRGFEVWKHVNPRLGDVYIGTVKHIHQLQNLFYYLTGEELNVKE